MSNEEIHDNTASNVPGLFKSPFEISGFEILENLDQQFSIDKQKRRKKKKKKHLTASCCFSVCDKRSSCYGIPGSVPTHCAEHKEDGHISNPETTCLLCPNPATFGIYTVGIHCKEHKEDNEISLIQRICAKCNEVNIVNENLLCSLCGNHNYGCYLQKQREVKRWINNWSTENTLTIYKLYDSSPNSELTRQRPDFTWQCADRYIFLEVDEHQHKDTYETYEGESDVKRMITITRILNTPCIWIRYNPDIFKLNGSELNADEKDRKRVLHCVLKQCLEMTPLSDDQTKNLQVIYLFYDEFDIDSFNIEDVSSQFKTIPLYTAEMNMNP